MNAGEVKKQEDIMLNNFTKHPEAQDAGTIILAGFEPDIVLNSIKTVIDEYDSRLTSWLYNNQHFMACIEAHFRKYKIE